MSAYYNEFEPYAADWLENLIAAGHLPAGDVDRRDIREVSADDLEGYEQCHFFAGIGGWPLALALAGWQGPVWTGSCPCQPFSSAGRAGGLGDERHLWPAFQRLIAERAPANIFGEQVASKDGRRWLAGVRLDLEALGYAVGAADLCAAGIGEEAEGRFMFEDNSFVWKPIVVGPPHIRQRLFWLADAGGDERGAGRNAGANGRTAAEPAGLRDPGGVAESDRGQRHGLANGQGRKRNGQAAGRQQGDGVAEPSGPTRRLGDAAGGRRQGDQRRARPGGEPEPAGPGFWRDFDLVPCADGKARRVEPGTFPLAHGVPQRVGKLRAYGNAIVPQVAAEFVSAFMECRP